MFYYLAVVVVVYVTFLVARHEDREGRKAFAGRLRTLYRLRSEFWKLRVWADEARQRGDEGAAARFSAQAADELPEIGRRTVALRREFPEYAGEIGWIPGMPDEELAEMAQSVASYGLQGYERWITGKGRPPMDAILTPRPGIEDDALSARIHMAFGAAVGAVTGFLAWMVIYWGRMDARISTMVLFMVIGAAVLGHVAGAARDTLWSALARSFRRRMWWFGRATTG